MQKTIFIGLLALLYTGSLLAQNRVVTGTVTEADTGEPVIGATILAQASATGAVTDFDGNYRITLTTDDAVLEFSYLGRETQVVEVGDRTRLDIALAEAASLLEEVVVIGYGTEKRSNISGSVATVSAEELAENPVTRVEQALQGRTAGVQVAQNSGSPGSGLTVRIRGIGTINNSDPLYIVDGVPVDNIDFLNPDDVSSMNVLKDAASAAIYGARGANGVVLITTKDGKGVKSGQIEVNSYTGFQQPWKYLNLLSAREYAIISNEARINAGLSPRPELANPDLLGEGTDWQAAIFENAPLQSHQIRFANSTDKSNISVSAAYYDQEGIVGGEKSAFERYTARLVASTEVKPWLTLGNNISFTYLNRNFLPENNDFTTPLVRALNMDPVTPVRKADGTFAYSVYSDTDIVNPVNAIAQTFDQWNSSRIVGNVFAEVQPITGLSVRTVFSTDATFATRKGFIPIYDLSNDPILRDAPGGERSDINTVFLNNNTWRKWQWENIATYDRSLTDDLTGSLTLGTSAIYSRADFSGGANTDLPTNDPDDAFLSNTIGSIESQSTYGVAEESALASVFGRLKFNFADRYNITATLRRDGSSRFGANNRYGYFPSVSAAWRVSEESFFESNMISSLKLRASWGQNGNDNIGLYGFSTLVLNGQNYTFGEDETITNGALPLVPANPDLQWETSTQTNFGLDLELWNGKFYFVTDYYIKETTDMLYVAPIPYIVGSLPPFRNVGSVKNNGWELALTHRNNFGKFDYEIGGNIAFVDNQVTGLGNESEPLFTGRVFSSNAFVARTEIGQPIASFYGYVTDGIFQTEEEVVSHAFQNENTRPGDIRFRDLNNDGIIDADDRTYIGNPTPDFTYGFTGKMNWQNFDLNIFFQGSHGNEIYNGTVRYDFASVNRPQSVLNRWTGPGTSNTEPRVSTNDPNQNARVSDRFVEDGSYLRLKNLQLGYTLPGQWMERIGIQRLRFYVGAQNLFTWTDYSGLDPEIGAYGALEIGIDRGFYPQARTWLVGANLGF